MSNLKLWEEPAYEDEILKEIRETRKALDKEYEQNPEAFRKSMHDLRKEYNLKPANIKPTISPELQKFLDDSKK